MSKIINGQEVLILKDAGTSKLPTGLILRVFTRKYLYALQCKGFTDEGIELTGTCQFYVLYKGTLYPMWRYELNHVTARTVNNLKKKQLITLLTQ